MVTVTGKYCAKVNYIVVVIYVDANVSDVQTVKGMAFVVGVDRSSSRHIRLRQLHALSSRVWKTFV